MILKGNRLINTGCMLDNCNCKNLFSKRLFRANAIDSYTKISLKYTSLILLFTSSRFISTKKCYRKFITFLI